MAAVRLKLQPYSRDFCSRSAVSPRPSWVDTDQAKLQWSAGPNEENHVGYVTWHYSFHVSRGTRTSHKGTRYVNTLECFLLQTPSSAEYDRELYFNYSSICLCCSRFFSSYAYFCWPLSCQAAFGLSLMCPVVIMDLFTGRLRRILWAWTHNSILNSRLSPRTTASTPHHHHHHPPSVTIENIAKKRVLLLSHISCTTNLQGQMEAQSWPT